MYKVLLVEDDTALHFIYKSMKTWSDHDYVIAAEATNGRDALEILKNEKFDLIFTDIRMPFVDGIGLLKEVKESGDSTPVVFASSYSEFEYAKQGITYGVFDYLIKPIDDEKLGDLLERVKGVIDEQNDVKISYVVQNVLDELGVSAKEDEFVKQIAVYCTEHYRDDFTADDLADLTGFRTDYFGKLFKQHFGITYNDFRPKVKIGYAIELMKTGNYKAYEISDMLGYQSYKYFSERFKKVTGVAPTEYKFGNGSKK